MADSQSAGASIAIGHDGTAHLGRKDDPRAEDREPQGATACQLGRYPAARVVTGEDAAALLVTGRSTMRSPSPLKAC